LGCERGRDVFGKEIIGLIFAQRNKHAIHHGTQKDSRTDESHDEKPRRRSERGEEKKNMRRRAIVSEQNHTARPLRSSQGSQTSRHKLKNPSDIEKKIKNLV
jgi:hypothetical protein